MEWGASLDQNAKNERKKVEQNITRHLVKQTNDGSSERIFTLSLPAPSQVFDSFFSLLVFVLLFLCMTSPRGCWIPDRRGGKESNTKEVRSQSMTKWNTDPI